MNPDLQRANRKARRPNFLASKSICASGFQTFDLTFESQKSTHTILESVRRLCGVALFARLEELSS
jgi:hypothetical protein